MITKPHQTLIRYDDEDEMNFLLRGAQSRTGALDVRNVLGALAAGEALTLSSAHLAGKVEQMSLLGPNGYDTVQTAVQQTSFLGLKSFEKQTLYPQPKGLVQHGDAPIYHFGYAPELFKCICHFLPGDMAANADMRRVACKIADHFENKKVRERHLEETIQQVYAPTEFRLAPMRKALKLCAVHVDRPEPKFRLMDTQTLENALARCFLYPINALPQRFKQIATQYSCTEIRRSELIQGIEKIVLPECSNDTTLARSYAEDIAEILEGHASRRGTS